MYSFDSRVRYSEVDKNGRLSLVSMIDYLQDCSTFQCEDVCEGITGLKGKGYGWILASWRIEISRLPKFNEKITTSTWCYEMKRLHAMRNFQICDAAGNALVTADSQWYLFDFDQRKVARIPDDQLVYLEDTPRAEMGKMERKIAVEGEGREASPITVGVQHLDTNNHVNNAQYVLMAVGALRELGLDVPTDVLSIQYRSMALLGDVIQPFVHDCEGGHVVVLASPAGDVFATIKLQGK